MLFFFFWGWMFPKDFWNEAMHFLWININCTWNCVEKCGRGSKTSESQRLIWRHPQLIDEKYLWKFLILFLAENLIGPLTYAHMLHLNLTQISYLAPYPQIQSTVFFSLWKTMPGFDCFLFCLMCVWVYVWLCGSRIASSAGWSLSQSTQPQFTPQSAYFPWKNRKKQILIIFRQWVMLAVAVCNASAEVMGLSTSSYTPNHTN